MKIHKFKIIINSNNLNNQFKIKIHVNNNTIATINYNNNRVLIIKT